MGACLTYSTVKVYYCYSFVLSFFFFFTRIFGKTRGQVLAQTSVIQSSIIKVSHLGANAAGWVPCTKEHLEEVKTPIIQSHFNGVKGELRVEPLPKHLPFSGHTAVVFQQEFDALRVFLAGGDQQRCHAWANWKCQTVCKFLLAAVRKVTLNCRKITSFFLNLSFS